MGIANFPFPSFTFVLTSDRVVIPGPSYVIRIAPLVVLPPHPPQTTVLTTNVANDENHPLAILDIDNDSVPDVVLSHSDADESVYDATEMMTVQTRATGNKLSLLKMRRFRFKSIFKRSTMVTYSN